jgi:hypothetical protein
LSRSAGFSIPWSTALRMMCVSGSRIISIISRSSSTSPPSMSTSTCLPSSADKSRTMRGRPTNRFSIRCMRVRVIASRMSAMIADRRSNAPSTETSVGLSRSAGKLVAGKHHVGDGAHDAVEKLDRKADGARRGSALLPVGDGCRDRRRRAFGPRRKRVDQRAVVARRHLLAGVDCGDHLADPVDDREHGADQLPVGLAPTRANVGERVLGGVAERLEPREFEEAAIALHRVDEAENAVEARAVVGLGFPGDDLPAQGFEHFAAFGYEIGNQVIHWSGPFPSAASNGLMQRRS